MISYIRRQVVN